jgi:ribonuclease HI
LLEGLKLAREMKFSRIEVRVDSSGVVNDIIHNKYSRPHGKTLVAKICRMLELDWEVVINHYYREANILADALANHSYSLSVTCCFFDDCPSDFKHLLDADEKGIGIPRTDFL